MTWKETLIRRKELEGGKWGGGGKRTGRPTLPKVNRMKLKAEFRRVNQAQATL